MDIRERVSQCAAALALFSTAASAHAAIIINEMDYDQPGADSAEFVELFNTEASPVVLDGYTLTLVNGTSGSVYDSFALDGYSLGANAYFLLCNSGSLAGSCNYDVASDGWIQNGGSSGDAVALYYNSQLVDSVVYEAVSAPLASFAEGGTHAGEDSRSFTMSLSRITDGIDTDINSSDFSSGCLTPGSANIAGQGDCSGLSAVPLPAAAWLFGSGLLGMMHLARRRRC